MDNLREGARRWHGLATRSGRELATRRGGSGSGISGSSRVAGLGIIMVEFGTEQARMEREEGESRRRRERGRTRKGVSSVALLVQLRHFWLHWLGGRLPAPRRGCVVVSGE